MQNVLNHKDMYSVRISFYIGIIFLNHTFYTILKIDIYVARQTVTC